MFAYPTLCLLDIALGRKRNALIHSSNIAQAHANPLRPYGEGSCPQNGCCTACPGEFYGAMGNRLRRKIMLAETQRDQVPCRANGGTVLVVWSVVEMNRAWCKVPAAGRSLRPELQPARVHHRGGISSHLPCSVSSTREEKITARNAALVFIAARKGQPTRFELESCSSGVHAAAAYLRPDLCRFGINGLG